MALAAWSAFRLGHYTSSASNSAIKKTVADTHFMHAFFDAAMSSGDNRGFYLRVKYTGGGGGEALRAFSIANNAIGTMHGAHITAQIGTAGSITGLIAGVRATLATSAGLTLSGGTAHALRIDTSLGSAITGMTLASLIGVYELETAKTPYFMSISGASETDSATVGVRYKSGAYTPSGCKWGLRVKLTNGEGWIPVYDTFG